MAIVFSILIALVVCWFAYISMKPVSKAGSADRYFEKGINLTFSNDTFLRTERKRKKDD